MTRVHGPLSVVTDNAAAVSSVQIRAEYDRPHNGGLLINFGEPVPTPGGVLDVNLLPGPAVMVLMGAGQPTKSIPLLVPDTPAASLADCVRLVGLADDATRSELERLAAEALTAVSSARDAVRDAGEALVTAQEAVGVVEGHADRAEEAEAGAVEAEEGAEAGQELSEDAAAVAVAAAVGAAEASSDKADTTYVDAADQALGRRVDKLDGGGPSTEAVTVSGVFPTNPGWATLNVEDLPDGWSMSSSNTVLSVPGGAITAVADIPDVGTASLRWVADDGTAQMHTITGPSTTVSLNSVNGGQLVVTGSGGSGYGGKAFSVTLSRTIAADPVVVRRAWSRTAPIQFWGDSAVAGGDNGETWAAGEDLPAQLETHLTVPVENLGKGGWSSSDIIFHAGFLEVWATPVGGQIPASGAVEMDLHGMELQTDPGRAHIVEIAGVRGTFSQITLDQWQFTRHSSGGTVPVSGPVRVTPIQHFDTRSTQVILMGGNDRGSTYGTGPSRDKDEMSLSNYLRAVQAVPADPVRHILIGGVKTRASTWPGDDQHIHVQSVNETLRHTHPESFVDRNAWLAARGLDILGLTPTADDLHKMENGVAPARVFADDTHVRKEVVAVEAAELWAPALQLRGWA